MCSPEPGKGRGGGGDGLLEFWSCLDPKQRESLLTLNGRSVQGALDCDLCRDLVGSATLALEEEAKVDAPPPSPASSSSSPNALASGGGGGKGKPKPPKQKPKMGAAGLRVIGDRAFLADWVGGPEVKRKGPCFVKYVAGVYVMQSSKALDKAVREMAAFQAPWEAVAVERGCYCRGKILLRVVDMLTYPRPVRKFQILVEKNMELMTLREMMLAHVKVESILRLVLLTRGKPLAHSNNHLTMAQLGFKSRQQLVVSQVLGGSTQDETGIEEKNRQFVGDLLFGGGGVSGEARRSLLKNRTPFPSSSSSTSSQGPNLTRAMRGGKAVTGASPTIPPSPPPLPSSKPPYDTDADDENGVGKPPRDTGGSSENDSTGPESASPKGAGIEELLNLVAVEGDTGSDTAAEMLADGIAGVGVEGEAGGEPGTGRVPSLLANHGFQVLGKTLSRLACHQVAEAWRAELQAREHETRLLEELEAEAGGGVEEEGTASKRRTKKAKKKERDKKRREEEKRLQQQKEDRKEQLRLEKMRQAEERLEEERRAKLIQERAEHEKQAQLWKLAQEKRVIAEREQLRAQMSLLRVADEEFEALGMSEAVKSAPTAQAVGACGSGDLGGGRGKDKKNKGKKQHQQQKQRPQQQQQRRQQHQRVSVKGVESTSSDAGHQGPSASGSQEHKQQQLHAHAVAPSRTSNGIIGSRVTTAAEAGCGGGGGEPGESADGNTTSSSCIVSAINQFAGIAHARPQHLQQPRLAPLPASQAAVGVAAAGVHDPSPQPSTGFPPASQQQQYRQSQYVPPGPIAPPPTARSASSLSPQHSSTAVASAGYAPQHQHVGVCTTTSSLGVDSRDRIGTTPGLATGVISAVAPVATVIVSTGLPPSTSASPSASAVVLTGTTATVGGGVSAGAGVPLVTANFCAFCGGRLVAVTANFCAFCGQRVMRSPDAVERVPSPPLPSCPSLVMPTPQLQQQVQQAQQPLLSRAVTPPHQHGPVGGERGKQWHGHGHAHSQPPPPSQQQQQTQAAPPSGSSRGNNVSAASAPYLQQDGMPITNSAVGDDTGVARGGGGGGGDDGSRSGVSHGPGEGTGSGSGSLPFFQQFRGAKGSGGRGGGDAHVATVGAGVSAAPGAGRPTRGGGEEAANGEATAHGESNGSSTLEGILEVVIGPLGGGEGESGGVNGTRHPW